MSNIDVTLLAKPNETIEEHTNNIVHITEMILHKIPRVIKRIAAKMNDAFFKDFANKENEIFNFIVNIVRFHDYGKVNPHFQAHIKAGAASKVDKKKRQHAIYSFLLWLVEEQKQVEDERALYIRSMVAYATIVGHHSHLKEMQNGFLERSFKDIEKKLKALEEWEIIDEGEYDSLEDIICDMSDGEGQTEMDLYLTFSKFLFSILVTSDSIASSEIVKDDYLEAVEGLLFKDINNTNFHEKMEQAPILESARKSSMSSDASFKDATSMKDVRVLLNKKSVASWDEEKDIYILEAPVGTGKTLSSLSLVDHLIQKEKKRKIISVFPLNSVQTQYVDTVVDTIQVDKNTVNVINSENLFSMENHDYNSKFAINTSNLWLFERSCFSNEFIITSHVRFFQTFVAYGRNDALGFLGLIDSVVIIDEFQNYPSHYWFAIWGELLRISELFGTKWVFTTGTFPVSEQQLNELYGNKVKKVLSCEENNELFSSPYVKDRCNIERLNLDYYKEMEKLSEDIEQDIRMQEQCGINQHIICLSYVKHTKQLHRLLKEKMNDYMCYFLCGRHSSLYKKELMKTIERHNKSKGDKIILVTTKTVECGMDFDFDNGYKEFDMFDSVEQLSGRVNRSNNKPTCKVKVFQIQRFKQEHEKIYNFNDTVLRKLKNKEFISLYEDLYDRNRVSISKYEQDMIAYHKECLAKDYQDYLTIIEETNYCQDILWVTKENEEAFISILQSQEMPNTYGEKRQQSLILRKKLEPFTMTVTTKWLEKRKENELELKECNGLPYYLVTDNEKMAYFLEKYELNGTVSYLENNDQEVVELV